MEDEINHDSNIPNLEREDTAFYTVMEFSDGRRSIDSKQGSEEIKNSESSKASLPSLQGNTLSLKNSIIKIQQSAHQITPKIQPNQIQNPNSQSAIQSSSILSMQEGDKQHYLLSVISEESRKREQKVTTHEFRSVQINCILQCDGKQKVKTNCTLKDCEVYFENSVNLRISRIYKLKIYFENSYRCLEISYKDKLKGKDVSHKYVVVIENDSKDILYRLFSNLLIRKLLLLDNNIDTRIEDDPEVDKGYFEGEIYKKSQVLHNWEKRKIILTDRLESFKNNKCTYEIKKMKELWTRFQKIESCLVMKVRHGMYEKTELGIPVTNYIAKYSKNNWLYRMYKLIHGET